MEVLSTEGCPMVRLGTIVSLTKPTNYWLENADPVLNMLDGTFLDLGWYPVEDVVHDSMSSLRPHTEIIAESRPRLIPYQVLQDRLDYGSFLEGFKMFVSTLGFSPASSFSNSGENQCIHEHLKGHTRTFPRTTWIDPSQLATFNLAYFPFYQTVMSHIRLGGYPVNRIKRRAALGSQLYELVNDDYYGRVPTSLGERLNDLTEKISAGSNGWESYTFKWDLYSLVRVKNATVNFTEDLCSVVYDIEWSLSPNYSDLWTAPKYFWRMRNAIALSTLAGAVLSRNLMEVGEIRYLDPPVTLTTSFESVCTEHTGWGAPWTYKGAYLWTTPYNNGNIPTQGHVDRSSSTNAVPLLLTYISEADEAPLLTVLQKWRRSDIMTGFARNVSLMMSDIRAASFLSSSDSLDDVTSSIDNNLIEALSELPELLGVIPDLKTLFQIVNSFRGVGLVNTAGALMRWVASENLRLSFGTRPLVQLISESLPRLIRALTTLRNLPHRPVKGYGTYSYEFPQGTFGRNSSFLVVRTKAVFNSYPSGPLASALGLSSLGLLPSASNLWDLIPLSFVIDWGLNVSDRLKDIENTALIGLMDLRCMVHTYTVTSPVYPDELAEYGIEPESNEPLIMKVFRREVSRHVAPPRSSKFDFRFPSKPPSWMIAGSLLATR